MVAKKTKKQTSTPKKKGITKWFFILFLGLLGVLIMAVYASLLMALFSGDLDNPLFAILGIAGAQLKGVLIQITNGIFGLSSLLLLILTLVAVFRRLTTPKKSAYKKKRTLAIIIWGFLFVLMASLWMFLYFTIASAKATEDNSEPVIILTQPAITKGLEAPVMIDFSVRDRLPKYVPLNDVTQVRWDFDGDDKVDATGFEVSNRYISKGELNGIFQVKAIIEYDYQGERKLYTTRHEVVIDNVKLQPIITVNQSEGAAPLVVEFNAVESVDPDGDIYLYEWDFDDDGEFEVRSQTPEIIEREFDRIGEYLVKLRVTGNKGDTEVAEQLIVIEKSPLKVEARITSEQPFEAPAPFDIVLDGSKSFTEEGFIKSYEWFVEGEKQKVESRRIRRTFRTPGEYTVTLDVENTDGERHSISKVITVLGEAIDEEVVILTSPEVNKQGVVEGKAPFQVRFDGSKSKIKNPIEWQWDIGNDGTIEAYEKAITHVYREPGQYLVKLVIIDAENNRFEKPQAIVVDRSGVNAKISSDRQAGDVPLNITFDGSGSTADKGQIIDYIWHFPGKDPIHYGAQISHVFRSIGTFKVKLEILTSEGERSETETYVSVRAPSVRAEFMPSVSAGAAPLDVTFDPTLSQGVITEYYWDFGNGFRSRETAPSHRFNTPGTYNVRLKVVNANGVFSEVFKRIRVTQ